MRLPGQGPNRETGGVFADVTPAPPDPILGLGELFKADPRADKLDLTVGVYCDETGRTPVMEVVRAAQAQLIAAETSKTYQPIAGSATFAAVVKELVAPGDAATQARLEVAQAPGGTGALTVAGRLLWSTYPDATVWISDPTWPNHRGIFADCGLEVRTYPYYDADTATVRFDALLEALAAVGPHDAVVLHGCCHNPTGQDLTAAQWAQVGAVLAERGALAIVDTAYIGLGDGLEEDATGLRAMVASGADVAACLSFSKNLGLYGERAGALVVAGHSPEQAELVQSRVKACIRTIYSNPPITAGVIVATILASPELRAGWHAELAEIRDRINGLRAGLAAELAGRNLDRCRGTATGKGMFALTGLTRDEVLRLRDEAAIYLVENGRMNLAALTEATIPRFVDALEKLS